MTAEKWSVDDPPFSEVGCIGFMVYMPLFLFLCLRLYLSVKEDINPQKKRNRMLFHLSMFLYVLLETVALIIVWDADKFEYPAVVVHFIAIFCNIVGFSIAFYSITKLIFRLEFNDQHTVFWVIVVFLGITFLSNIAYMFAYGIHGDDCSTRECINVSVLRDMVEGLSVFLLSLNFSITGYRISRRIFMTQMGFNWASYLKSSNEMLKINIITIACTFFYLMRVFFIITIVIYELNPLTDGARVTDFYGVIWENDLYWFALSKWLTFIIPTLLLLHLMRPKISIFSKKTSVGDTFEQTADGPINVIYNSKLHETSVSDDNNTNNYANNSESQVSESGTEDEDFVLERNSENFFVDSLVLEAHASTGRKLSSDSDHQRPEVLNQRNNTSSARYSIKPQSKATKAGFKDVTTTPTSIDIEPKI